MLEWHQIDPLVTCRRISILTCRRISILACRLSQTEKRHLDLTIYQYSNFPTLHQPGQYHIRQSIKLKFHVIRNGLQIKSFRRINFCL